VLGKRIALILLNALATCAVGACSAVLADGGASPDRPSAAGIPQSAAPSVPADDQARLTRRGESYWALRRGSDLAGAYEFYAEPFRQATPRSEFLRNYQRLIRFPPDETTVLAVQFSPSRREARVTVQLKLTRDIQGTRVPLETVSVETWILRDDEWWKEGEPFTPNV